MDGSFKFDDSAEWNCALLTDSIGRLVTTNTDDQDIRNYIISMDGSYEPFSNFMGLLVNKFIYSILSCRCKCSGGNPEYAESMAIGHAFQLPSQELHGMILFCPENKNIIDFLNGHGAACWQTKFNFKCFM